MRFRLPLSTALILAFAAALSLSLWLLAPPRLLIAKQLLYEGNCSTGCGPSIGANCGDNSLGQIVPNSSCGNSCGSGTSCIACCTSSDGPCPCGSGGGDPTPPSPDLTPPTTTASISGPAGASGWYRGPLTVSLSAVDNGGPGPASGVAATYFNGSPYSGPVTISGEGVTSFTYYSRDNANNTESTRSGSVSIDSVAPTASCASSGTLGQNGWYVSNVAVTCASSDATSGVASNTFDNNPYTSPVTISTQGSSSHDFVSADVAGSSSTQTVALAIDTAAPVSAVASHTNNRVVFGVITLSGTASDAALAYPAGQASGVGGVEISLDNAATWQPAAGTTAWSYTLDTATLPDGHNAILARSTDNAGNVQSPTTSLALVVDNLPPDIALDTSCPVGAGEWCHAPVTVTLRCSDAGSGAASITYDSPGNTTTIAGESASFVVGKEGVVSAYCIDRANRRSATRSATIRVDGAPPTARFLGGDRLQLSVDISDAGSGVERWTLQVFDASGRSVYWGESSQAFFGAVIWDTTSLAGGVYYAEIFASDRARLETHVARTAFTLADLATPTPALTPAVIVGVVSLPTLRPPTMPAPITSPTPEALPTLTTVAVAEAQPASAPAVAPETILLSGVLFRDDNRNGVQDESEPGLAGISVQVYWFGSLTPPGAGLIDTTVSGPDGRYSLQMPGSKRYLLKLVTPDELFPTTPGSFVVFENTQSAAVFDFGLTARASLFMVLLLLALLGFVLVWLTSAALDRRASAIRAIGEDIGRKSAARRALPPPLAESEL